MDAAPLPDPESQWKRAPALASVDRAEIERRVGPIDGPLAVLGGGHANVNLRIGDRVVRLYRRDPGAAPREARLLTYGWRTFRVPTVLRTGDDFLVLEYVEKHPLLGTSEHGSAVGRALAEIHTVTFESTGLLDASLRVERSFPDLTTALVDHARLALNTELCGLASALCADWTNRSELLVLDWEFAYAGSALSDIGQLLRWRPPEVFANAFAETYSANGGHLIADWRRWAAAFDLVNLAGLLVNTRQSGRDISRATHVPEVQRRVEQTLNALR